MKTYKVTYTSWDFWRNKTCDATLTITATSNTAARSTVLKHMPHVTVKSVKIADVE